MTGRQILAGFLLGVLAVAAVCVLVLPHWFWEPLGVCKGTACGYQFWSGIAGSFATSSGLWTGCVLFYWKHQCHQHGCLRPAFHIHPDHGHPVCKRHYEQHPDGAIPGKP